MSYSSSHPTLSPLLRNLVLFGRFLRRLGLRVAPAQISEVADSLSLIEIGSVEDVRNVARAILVNRREDLPVFDRAFDLFWGNADIRQGPLPDDFAPIAPIEMPGGDGDGESQGTSGSAAGAGFSVDSGTTVEASDEDGEGESALALYSAGESLRHKDFGQYTPDELADAQRFLNGMRWAVTRRRSLRQGPSKRGRRLDLRRSLRANLRHGGEMFRLARRAPKLKRRRLVLLCDISGSMDRYTRLLLHFLHSMERSLDNVEVFVFGTRLTRITHALRTRDPDSAIAAVADEVQDWSGGTRIGESLHTFNRRWARRVLGHGAIVLIISDGWDRGDPAVLAREMERLQRESYRLIWLNPLLGAPGYEPLTQGILAALPSIDDFLPVHSIASLEELARILDRVQEGRPERRQVLPRAG
jgi:uncharacterized protein with von Willebrand factor type A (vWA) domain